MPTARKLEVVSYDEMLEMAAAGANVLQSRSVEYARRHGVKLHVRSAFDDAPGTWVQEVADMEGVLISGVALDTGEAKVTLERVPDRPGVAALVFKAIAEDAISIDMIVQNISHAGATDLSFTAPLTDIPRLQGVMERIVKEIGAERFTMDQDIAKISLIGAGMKTHPGVAADMFDCLAAERRQHRDDLDLADPHLVRDPQGRRRAGGWPDPRAVRPRCDRILARHRHRLTDRCEGRC